MASFTASKTGILSTAPKSAGRTRAVSCSASVQSSQEHHIPISKRACLSLITATTALALTHPAKAVQGLTAGRIPGVSTVADEDGYYKYQRPEGKSGGHGVGWSEIPRYSFKVPAGWDETPVSIADLGGTEIDLRFANKDQGDLVVVVAPVLRFADIGFNANVRIEDLGTSDRIIAGFAPEIFGKPLDENDVLETEVVQKEGNTYYQWMVKPHHLISATATGNRLFILNANATPRQWKKYAAELRHIQQSFFVPPARV